MLCRDGRLVGAPVCEGHKDSVLECYASHPKRPLECSSQVAAYLQCVERARKVRTSHCHRGMTINNTNACRNK